jgi:monoamine oxidase
MIIDGKWQSKAEDNEDAVLASLMHKAEQIDMPDSHESMADYLLRLGMPASQYPSAFRTIEFDSDSFSRWSAQTLMALTGDNLDSDYGLSDFHVVGGQKTMLDVLAEGLDIRLGQVAQHIDWGKHVATVEMVNGRVYQARRVVITVPPLVLQKRALVFKPDLPASKWRAIDAFQRCDIVKILLHFAAPVFPSDYGTLLDMKGILPIWWRSNEGYPHFKGDVLVGWAAGDHARHLIALGSEAIPNALNSLRAALNQPDLIPIAARMQHWNDDPFANGAYPLIPPGGEKAVSTLAAPLGGVLFWAGAATSADFTSVHGAYASGKRVALEVSASLQH